MYHWIDELSNSSLSYKVLVSGPPYSVNIIEDPQKAFVYVGCLLIFMILEIKIEESWKY